MRRSPRQTIACAALLAAVVIVPVASAVADPVIVAAGDIASGGQPDTPQRRTARLVEQIDPRAVLVLGDNQYSDGAYADYLSSYDPTWGRFKAITHPTPGNHDYHTAGAAGYFKYFGYRAHRTHGGYYSFDIGAWHVVAVNSGTGAVSKRQLDWIRSDLAANRSRCELAFWHHPRWSSGADHGSDGDMAALWSVLYRAGVDVVLNGHDHEYERFAPLTPAGKVAPRKGVREFVIGTGGAELYGFDSPIRGSEKRIRTHGVLKLTLHPTGYSWAFVRTDGTGLDHGAAGCHGPRRSRAPRASRRYAAGMKT